MRAYVGVDLGGTNLRAAVVDPDTGMILDLERCPTQAQQGQAAVTRRIVSVVQAAIKGSGLRLENFDGVGIGIPGTPDMDRGTTILMTNFPGQWRDVPLKAILEAELRLPVALINDVRALTLAEWKFGAGKGAETLACFAIGTGIGGGLVVNGRLHLGIGGTAGELGHTVVEVDGLPCGCGGRGCLELYASGPAIAAMGAREVMQGHTTQIGELSGYDLNKITAELVVQAARLEDPLAVEILRRAGTYLGVAVSSLIATISPQKVIFGGGVAQAGDLLLDVVRKVVRDRVHVVPVDQIEFATTALGASGGLVGAALWAEQNLSRTEG